MKPLFTGWKLPVLIGVLVILALVINVFFFNKAKARRETKAQEQREAAATAQAKQAEQAAKAQSEEEQKKTIEGAITEHNRFLARYLNSGFTRKQGVTTIGVAIESDQGTMDPDIANALAQRLASSDVQLLNSFFKPEFVADKFVASIFAGDTKIFDLLDLTNSLNGVVIGRQSVTYSTNAALQNTVTANLGLEVMALPIGVSRPSQSWNFAVKGVGFNPQEARQAAEERIVDQIAKSTNIVLAPKFSNE